MMRNLLSTRAAVPSDLEQIDTRSNFEFRGSTLVEADRSIEARISTGTRVQMFDYKRWEMVDEILIPSGMRSASSVPLLPVHNSYTLNTLGSARDAKVVGNEVIARLFFVKDDPDVDRVWNRVKQGHLNSVSVGYIINRDRTVEIAPNTTAVVDGVSHKAGERWLRVVNEWDLKEVSVVPIAADQLAKMRSAAQPPRTRKDETAMNPQLLAYLRSIGLSADATEAEALRFLANINAQQRAYSDTLLVAGGQPAGAAAPNTTGNQPAARAEQPLAAAAAVVSIPIDEQLRNATEEGRRAEQNRCREIRALASPATGDVIPAALVERMINEHQTIEQARAAFLGHYQSMRSEPVTPAPGIIVRSNEVNGDLLAASLMHRCGHGERIIPRVGAPGVTPEQRAAREQIANQSFGLRHISLLDMARRWIELNSKRAVPGDHHELIELACDVRSLSGATFGSVFTDSINASMMSGYETVPDTTDGLFVEKSVRDFKVNTDIGVQATNGMALLPRGGEARHMTMDDNAETYRVRRFAEQGVVDEQDIIDDNLDALSEIPRMLGADAADIWPDLFYAFLRANPTLNSDSLAVFESGTHLNIVDQAYSATYLKAAELLMTKQTLNGRTLNLAPIRIVASPDLKHTILADLVSPTIVLAGTSGGVVEKGNVNTVQGLVKPTFEARLTNGVKDPITGTTYAGSATAWYLFADPLRARGIVRAVLAGNSGARVVTWVSQGKDGKWLVGYAIKRDVGIGVRGYRAFVRGNV